MTQRVWPPLVPFEPDARVLPAPLAATLAAAGGTAPVTLLVAGRSAIASGWAAPAAVALAEAWSRDGPRIVLADLSVGAAGLEQLVGETADEGLADVFFYGASLKRVIRSSPGRGFGFLPAGSSPVDSRDLLSDGGWRQIIAYFFREGASLLGYVPWSADGLSGLAARLGAVIALAAPADLDEIDSVLPGDAAVLAVVSPPGLTEADALTVPLVAGTGTVAFRSRGAAPPVPPDEARFAPPPARPAAPPAEKTRQGAPLQAPPGQAPPASPTAQPEEERFAPPSTPPGEGGPPAPPPGEARGAPPAEAPPEARRPKQAEPGSAPGAPPTPDASRWGPPSSPSAQAQAPEVRPVEPLEPLEPEMEERAAHLAREREERRQRTRPPEDPREALVEALWARRAGGPARPGLAPPVDLVPGRGVTEQDLLAEPPPMAPEPVGRRFGLTLILWLILGAAVVVGGVFAWQAWRNGQLPIPGIRSLLSPPATPTTTPDGSTATTTPAAPPALPAAAEGPAQADSLPYSVAIELHPEYGAAAKRVADLAREHPDVGFFFTPALVNGAIYYNVMAGPLPDSLQAFTLSQRLVDAGVKTGASGWDLVRTRLAFDLGDFPTRAEAEQRGGALSQKNVPTYVVEIPVPGAPGRWRLYAGAFAGTAEADVLRPQLKAAGLRESLVLRTGRTPR